MNNLEYTFSPSSYLQASKDSPTTNGIMLTLISDGSGKEHLSSLSGIGEKKVQDSDES